MLQSYARHDYPLVPATMGLRGDERVLDVGGGLGVLAGLLLDHHPSLQVWVLDRPEVVSQLPSRPGLHPLAGDLFDNYGVAVDVAVLSRVVHDWDDARAVALLRRVRAALPAGGRVFLVELLVSNDGGFGGLCDLHLMLATGGRERTSAEYAALLAAAGFALVELRAIGALPSVLVGVAR
jgi:SAM-dependent methyltransferase